MNVYDFDGTVYRGDSTWDFYRFALRRSISLLRYLPAQLWGLLGYLLGSFDKTAFKERFFRFLRGINDVEREVSAFWQAHRCDIAPWYLSQRQPDDLIISASPEFLLAPICRELGVRLIASEVDTASGAFLSPNCRGEEKVLRYKKAFGTAEIGSFYTDSVSDLPMAQLAQQAYIVKNGSPEVWKF